MKTILDYLKLTVEKYPKKLAFVDNACEITYKEFYDKSRKLATIISKKDVFNKPITILSNSSS